MQEALIASINEHLRDHYLVRPRSWWEFWKEPARWRCPEKCTAHPGNRVQCLPTPPRFRRWLSRPGEPSRIEVYVDCFCSELFATFEIRLDHDVPIGDNLPEVTWRWGELRQGLGHLEQGIRHQLGINPPQTA